MAEQGPKEPVDAYVVYEGGDLPSVDADSVLLEHRYERTTPRDTGAPYDLGAWIRADRARRAAAGAFDAGGHREVVVPAERCTPDDLPRAPKPIAKRLVDAGWEVRCSTGTVYVSRTLFASNGESKKEGAHSKGDLRFYDHDDTWWSVQAVMRADGKAVAAFWASWVTKEQRGQKPGTTFVDASTHDLVLGTEFTKVAGEFDEWLAIFAPPPPKPPKKKGRVTTP